MSKRVGLYLRVSTGDQSVENQRQSLRAAAEYHAVGLQIIGPEGEDRTTIEFARLLAAEIGGFVPPPKYT